jgi:hypothetical protein
MGTLGIEPADERAGKRRFAAYMIIVAGRRRSATGSGVSTWPERGSGVDHRRTRF